MPILPLLLTLLLGALGGYSYRVSLATVILDGFARVHLVVQPLWILDSDAAVAFSFRMAFVSCVTALCAA